MNWGRVRYSLATGYARFKDSGVPESLVCGGANATIDNIAVVHTYKQDKVYLDKRYFS